MKRSTAAIKEICRKNGLLLDEKLYEEEMEEMKKKYQKEYLGKPNGESNYILLIFNRVLCKNLKYERVEGVEISIPGWIKNNIDLSYYSNRHKIYAEFLEKNSFRTNLIANSKEVIELSDLLSLQISEEYKLKKVFYEEEANDFLYNETIKSLKKIVSDINIKAEYGKMTTELYKKLKFYYV